MDSPAAIWCSKFWAAPKAIMAMRWEPADSSESDFRLSFSKSAAAIFAACSKNEAALLPSAFKEGRSNVFSSPQLHRIYLEWVT